MSSYVGIFAAGAIFFTMATGFPHNVSRFLGMKKVTKSDYFKLVFIVWLFTGIPIMLDCSSNGLVARAIYGPALLKIEPWKGDLAAPMLAHAVGGNTVLALYVMGLFSAALSTLAGMVFIMSANVTRDIIKLWAPQTSDKSMLYFGYFLIALFLFIPFIWTLKRPPELLSIFMGMAAMGLGAVYFFVTAMSYYWKGATKAGRDLLRPLRHARLHIRRLGSALQETGTPRHGYHGVDPGAWLRHPLFWGQRDDQAAVTAVAG